MNKKEINEESKISTIFYIVNKLIDIDFQLRKIDLKYNIEKEVRLLISKTFISWDFKDNNIVNKVYKIKKQRFIEDKNLEELFDCSKEDDYVNYDELCSLFYALNEFYILCEKVIYNFQSFGLINNKDMHEEYHNVLENIIERFDLPSDYFYKLTKEKSTSLKKEIKAIKDISNFPHHSWLSNKIKHYIEKKYDWSPFVVKKNIKIITNPTVTVFDEFGGYQFTKKELKRLEIIKENNVFIKIIEEYATLEKKNESVRDFNLITLRELIKKENEKKMYDFEFSQLINKDHLKRFLRLFPELVLDFELIHSGEIITEEPSEFTKLIHSSSPNVMLNKNKVHRFKADKTVLRVGSKITYFPQDHIDNFLIALKNLSIPEDNISYDNRGFPEAKI